MQKYLKAQLFVTLYYKSLSNILLDRLLCYMVNGVAIHLQPLICAPFTNLLNVRDDIFRNFIQSPFDSKVFFSSVSALMIEITFFGEDDLPPRLRSSVWDILCKHSL